MNCFVSPKNGGYAVTPLSTAIGKALDDDDTAPQKKRVGFNCKIANDHLKYY